MEKRARQIKQLVAVPGLAHREGFMNPSVCALDECGQAWIWIHSKKAWAPMPLPPETDLEPEWKRHVR